MDGTIEKILDKVEHLSVALMLAGIEYFKYKKDGKFDETTIRLVLVADNPRKGVCRPVKDILNHHHKG